MKLAKVVPLFKKGDQALIENYRPISLLPAISKVFEKIVFNQLYEYFRVNNLLIDNQYGFRDNHSTEYAALEVVDRVLSDMDHGKLPIAIYIDLSKAFDTIDHDILVNKLNYYGIKGTPLKGLQVISPIVNNMFNMKTRYRKYSHY
jgi:retron-type reverse transcriptase